MCSSDLHHHAQGRAAVPFELHFVQLAGGGGQQHFKQVRFEAQHDGLSFGVTHAAVEFQRFGAALRVDHQAGIQKAGVGDAVSSRFQ